MTFSDSENFRCNICGAACKRLSAPPGREVPSCPACGSTVRLRSLIALLSREIFGVELAIPDFPVLKGIRGFGMSDPPELAQRLAEKFEYTNTFYHQEPRLDIADPSPEHLREHTGRYDFILTSEVLEHVSPPVERAFVNLNRMLKTDGLLLLTVPYRLDGRTVEHFPELHEYSLASPGGRTVLVNRRRDGSLEVFENLSFHGGDGSTLEMRVFSETSLKEIIAAAGFTSVRIASEDVPEFGVLHGETWSLPVVGRKGDFRPPSGRNRERVWASRPAERLARAPTGRAHAMGAGASEGKRNRRGRFPARRGRSGRSRAAYSVSGEESGRSACGAREDRVELVDTGRAQAGRGMNLALRMA